MPRVSVLMPVYNSHHDYLREAIDSVLSQTFTDFEFLILNDGSSDPKVEEIIQSFSDPRIQYTAHQNNMGISCARNHLLDMAQGEFLAIMDHDDVSLPERFHRQVTFLDAHPEVGIVGTFVSNMASGKTRLCPTDDIHIKKMLMIHCNLCHPSCMIRRSVLYENHIRYEEMFSPAEDYALFARLLSLTNFAILPETLLYYRDWKGNSSHKQAKKMEAAAQGVHKFMRRDNPELWAMAQNHLQRDLRIRLLGIPLFRIQRTRRETRFLLFGIIPLFDIKESLHKIINTDT